MTKALETTPEAGAEILGPTEGLNEDKYEALLLLADRIESVVMAQNKIRTALLKSAMPGDFVRFGDKVELTGPGAERIAANIGISIIGITDDKTAWKDGNGDAYTWRYIGDATLGKRVLEKVEGRASSRDKFFGYENGKWKELSEVKEADVRTSARRSLLKESVKLMLGLRSLPSDPAFLASIGLDPEKVRKVEFGGRGEQAVTASASGTPVLIKELKVFAKKDEVDPKDPQKVIKRGWTRYDVLDDKGAKYSTFDKKIAEFAKTLVGKMAVIDYEASTKGNDIKEIRPAEAPKDQEPNN